MDATPFRPHGIIGTVEAVDDRFARQAINPVAIENVANVAEQDNGGILVLVLARESNGGLSRPRRPGSAERIGNGDEGAPVVGLAIAQRRRHWWV
jgi:hypothetical protein